MPEVIVRKRLAKRSGGLKYRINRWFYRHRPTVAVVAAFVLASLVAIVAIHAGVGSINDRPADEASAPAQ
jgi:hypothetical protein